MKTILLVWLLLSCNGHASTSATCYLASSVGAFIRTYQSEDKFSVTFRGNDIFLYDLYLSDRLRNVGLLNAGEIIRQIEIKGTIKKTCPFPSDEPFNYSCGITDPALRIMVFVAGRPEPLRLLEIPVQESQVFQEKGPDTQGIGMVFHYQGQSLRFSDGLIHCQR
ncbi:MAG: hypothetical protein HYR96_13180 [Deltaproteobacteria bacterium]|nr:hypothetical protein [Deltaproteobacteria bacterium]MBI3295673.1 hypothetical protein [Deltaproteobacteria bacterium]